MAGVYPATQARGEWSVSEDISFFNRTKKAGILAYADTTIKCGHVGLYEFTQSDYERALQVGAFTRMSEERQT